MMNGGFTWDTFAHLTVAASTLICGGSALFMSLMRQKFAVREDVIAIDRRLVIIERLTAPDWLQMLANGLTEVKTKLEGLNATVQALKESQDHNRQSLESIQQYLLEHGK